MDHPSTPDLMGSIRRRVREVIELAIEDELQLALGAEHYGRTDGRRGYRNGAQVRTLVLWGGVKRIGRNAHIRHLCPNPSCSNGLDERKMNGEARFAADLRALLTAVVPDH